jgi:hypothetical protein
MSCTSNSTFHTGAFQSPSHKRKHFIVRFDYPEQQEAALHAGSVYVGTTPLLIQPWHLDSHTRRAGWNFHVKICIENLMVHEWSAEGARQVLGDICVFDQMEAMSFR